MISLKDSMEKRVWRACRRVHPSLPALLPAGLDAQRKTHWTQYPSKIAVHRKSIWQPIYFYVKMVQKCRRNGEFRRNYTQREMTSMIAKKESFEEKNNNPQLPVFAAHYLLVQNQALADVILGDLSQTLAVTFSMFLALLLFLCFIILKKISLLGRSFFWQMSGCVSTEWTDSRWHSGSMHQLLPTAPVRCNVTGISLPQHGVLWALRVYPRIKHLC